MESNHSLDIEVENIQWSKRSSAGKIKSSKSSSLLLIDNKEKDSFLFEGTKYIFIEKEKISNYKEIISINNYENLELLSPLYILKYMNDNNLNVDTIDKLGISLSFAYLKNAKRYLNKISIFTINGKEYNLEGKIILIPKGVGAKYTIEKFYNNIPSDYLIVDIEFLTLNCINVIDNKIEPKDVFGEEGFGTIRIARNLQEYISNKFNVQLTIIEIQEILKRKLFSIGEKKYDLSKLINEVSIKYTHSIIEYLKSKYEKEFKNYKKIFFVGSGSYYIKGNIPKIEILKKPEYANSIGQLLKLEEKK